MKEKVFPEIWYKIEYDIKESWMDFVCFKISGYQDKNNFDIENESIRGFIKGDGCMEFDQSEHYCRIEHAEQTLELFKEIYKIAKEEIEGNDI